MGHLLTLRAVVLWQCRVEDAVGKSVHAVEKEGVALPKDACIMN